MAPTYNLNYATGAHPYMTCIVKVDTRYNLPWNNWQKTIVRLLNKCHGIYSFKVDNNGTVKISGTVNPNVLLNTLGRAGKKVELVCLQFGQRPSNLFMPPNYKSGYNYDERYLHADNIRRPMIPSHESITGPHNHNHNYYNHHGHDHNNNHGYGHHGHDYMNNHDHHGYGHNNNHGYGHHGHDHRNSHGYGHHGYDHKNIYDEDMPECCIIM